MHACIVMKDYVSVSSPHD